MNIEAVDANLFGKRIRFLRRSRHWTQAELAGKVGIRTGPMNYLENGHHLPSLPVLCKLADVLEVSVDQILVPEPAGYIVRESQVPYGGSMVRQSEDVKFVSAADYRAGQALLVRFDPVRECLNDTQLDRLEKVIDAFLALEDICEVPKQAQIPLQIRLPASESGFERFVGQVRGLLGVNDAVMSWAGYTCTTGGCVEACASAHWMPNMRRGALRPCS